MNDSLVGPEPAESVANRAALQKRIDAAKAELDQVVAEIAAVQSQAA